MKWEPVEATIDEALAGRLLAAADLAIDCADNWSARVALAAAAWRSGVPLLHGAVAGWEGTVGWFEPATSPCFRCVYPRPSRPAEAPPVLGAAAGVVGSLMAAEAIRTLARAGGGRHGTLLLVDAERGTLDRVQVAARRRCPLCGG